MKNATGGTAIVHAAAAVNKRILRSSKTRQASLEDEEDMALMKEEEDILDEEVTSVEDNNDEAVEEAMMTVALVKSVVDTGGKPNVIKEEHFSDDGDRPQGNDPNEEGRYGLRKRPRSSGQDLHRLERMQSSNEGGLARNRPLVKQEGVSAVKSSTATTIPPSLQPDEDPSSTMSRIRPKSSLKPDEAPSLSKIRPQSSLQHDETPSATMSKIRPKSSRLPTGTTISSVPNPLAHNPIPLPKPLYAKPPIPVQSSVPCPLSSPLEPQRGTIRPQGSSLIPLPASLEPDKKKVTINEPPPSSRTRGLSIDMNCKLSDAMIRAWHLTLWSTVGIDFSVEPTTSSDARVTEGDGRDRAFSFECFAFGINADEPLPLLETSAVSHDPVAAEGNSNRPRGDSIIFDPASFQDGGIHERNALETSSTLGPHAAPAKGAPRPVDSTLQPPSSVPSATFPSGAASSSSAHQVPAIPMAASSGAAATTLSLDLVNKDGRIGIYLPDARRARIARFHAKRAKRIWRKRIKYDCRKKLADSRPRVKGRFVKRAEMDEE